MALTKCKDCGTEVSTKAGKCPKCAAPVSGPLMRVIKGVAYSVIGFFVLVMTIGIFAGDSDEVASGTSERNQMQQSEAETPETGTDTAEEGEINETEKPAQTVRSITNTEDREAEADGKVAENEEAVKAEINTEPCLTFECLARKAYAPAKRLCTAEIERQAQYDVEWTDSWTEERFLPYKLSEESPTAVMYMGDSVKFQNGFGAWQNMKYICKFETADKSVAEVAVGPGRL